MGLFNLYYSYKYFLIFWSVPESWRASTKSQLLWYGLIYGYTAKKGLNIKLKKKAKNIIFRRSISYGSIIWLVKHCKERSSLIMEHAAYCTSVYAEDEVLNVMASNLLNLFISNMSVGIRVKYCFCDWCSWVLYYTVTFLICILEAPGQWLSRSEFYIVFPSPSRQMHNSTFCYVLCNLLFTVIQPSLSELLTVSENAVQIIQIGYNCCISCPHNIKKCPKFSFH